MAKDKDKHLTKGQNFLNKGKSDKALEEFLAAFQLDKKDVKLQIKIGDLYAKIKDPAKAIEFYGMAAKNLTKDGFYSRSVAVFKQILQLDAANSNAVENLADLYGKLGLNIEALKQYQAISQQLERDGKVPESIEAVKKMLEIEPRNVKICTTLAGLYYKIGKKDEGYNAFRIALDQLQEEGRYEEYVRLLEKLAKADPDNNQNLKELSEIYVDHEQWDRAYAVLARICKNNLEDQDALKLLADVALKSGRPDESIGFLKQLAANYKAKGLRQRYKEALRQVLEIKPDDPEALAVVGKSETVLKAAEPEPVEETVEEEEIEEPIEELEEADEAEQEAIESGEVEVEGPPPAAAPLSDEQVKEQLMEADVYIKYGLRDKAINQIQAVLKIAPNNLLAHLKLKDIFIEAGDTQRATSELKFVARAGLKTGELKTAEIAAVEWLRLDPANAEARSLREEIARKVPKEAPKPPAPEELAAEEIEIEEEITLGGEGDEVEIEEEEEEAAAEVEEEAAEEEVEEEEEEAEEEVAEEEAAEEEVAEEEAAEEEVAEEEVAEEEAAEEEVAEEDVAEEEVAVEEEEAVLEEAPAPEASPDFKVELEEADFYLQQGLLADARRVYQAILDQDASNLAALEKITEIDAKLAEAEAPAAAPVEEVTIDEGEAGVAFDAAPAPAAKPVVIVPPPPPAAVEPPAPAAPKPPPAPQPAAPKPAPPPKPAAPPPAPAKPAVKPAAPPPPAPPPAAPAPAKPAVPKPAPPPPAAPKPKAPPPPPPVAPKPPPAAPKPPPAAPKPPPAAPAPALVKTYSLDDLGPEEPLPPDAPAADGTFFSGPLGAPKSELFGEESGGMFDLAAELNQEEDFFGGLDTGLAGSEEFSVDETIQAFKKGVAQQISEHDAETHFNLGIAYKEMGLIDDSLQEFLIASRDPARYADCMLTSAMILRETGALEKAIETCMLALAAEQTDNKTKAAAFIELGQSLLQKGEKNKARWSAEQGQATDPTHPEIANLLLQLDGVAPEAIALPTPKPATPPRPPGLPPPPPPDPARRHLTPPPGPPPSRASTSWQKAALDPQPDPASPDDGDEKKKKKTKKISFV